MGESACRGCGGRLPPYQGRGRPPEYCDRACRRRAERQRAATRQAARPRSGAEALLLAVLGQTSLLGGDELGAVEPAELAAADPDEVIRAMGRGR